MNKKTRNLTLLFSLTGAIVVNGCNTAAPTANSNTAVVQTNANSGSHAGMSHGDHQAMSHSGHGEMMKSDRSAASQPYDLQFIDTMIHHHEGAVQMSEIVLRKSQNEDLRKFAGKIINDQRREIAQMREWREKWYAGRAPAKNMEMTGMADSMKMMAGDEMKNWEAETGKNFDLRFLEMMIPHHDGAVIMSNEALQKAEHAEIKTLANQIIKEQQTEIKQMNEWREKWAK